MFDRRYRTLIVQVANAPWQSDDLLYSVFVLEISFLGDVSANRYDTTHSAPFRRNVARGDFNTT